MPPKKITKPPDFYTDWYTGNTKRNAVEKVKYIMKRNDLAQEKMINKKMKKTTEIPLSKYSSVFYYKDGKWDHIGYSCLECGKPMRSKTIVNKHGLVCQGKKKINNDE